MCYTRTVFNRKFTRDKHFYTMYTPHPLPPHIPGGNGSDDRCGHKLSLLQRHHQSSLHTVIISPIASLPLPAPMLSSRSAASDHQHCCMAPTIYSGSGLVFGSLVDNGPSILLPQYFPSAAIKSNVMLMNVVTGHRRHLLVYSGKRAYWGEWGHGNTADR